MASASALEKLESRAAAAESLIKLLKSQIAEAKGVGNARELSSLQNENSELKKELETWKTRLIQAQKNNGKTVFYEDMPSAKSAGQPTAVTENKSAAAAPSGPAPKAAPAAKAAPEKEKKPKKEKKESAPKAPAEPEAPIDVGRLDMRVGHIRSAKKHPDADSLYVEEVDVGEEKPRTVISGLVKFIPEADMQDRMAVLLCNLKPSKMRGIMSEAMVMCASTPDKVEILSPPPGSKPGDLVQVEGFTRNPDAQLNPKKKIFEACAPDLSVNGDKEACYKGTKWTVNGQPVVSQTLVNVVVK
eukprot:TRINITY_DN35053_c0_g3_i1.p1 TRINITY_DN35053_c0_g3~~TRINITY_DN35053_c0_g3_i1.p1  ORF type:complete len:311 (-),score=76.91 TRINITY_DN35053_c0_g3_i1:42-944(-)